MTVHFIGAGPGAPDLLTLRGRDLIAAADVVLYAGSLVPAAVVAHARDGALVIDSADMTLDELIACMNDAHQAGKNVARVHSGDSIALRRHRRADPPAGRARDRLRHHPGCPGLRRGRGRAGPGADPAGHQSDRGADPHHDAQLRHAEPGNPGNARALGRDARHPPLRAQHPLRRGEPDPPLRRGLPGGHRRTRELAGRADHPLPLDELHRSVKAERIRRTALILVGRVLAALRSRRQQAVRRRALSPSAAEEEAQAHRIIELRQAGLRQTIELIRGDPMTDKHQVITAVRYSLDALFGYGSRFSNGVDGGRLMRTPSTRSAAMPD